MSDMTDLKAEAQRKRNRAEELRIKAEQLQAEAKSEITEAEEIERKLSLQHTLDELLETYEKIKDKVSETTAKNLRGEIARARKALETGKPRRSRRKPSKPRTMTIQWNNTDYRCHSQLDLANLLKQLTGASVTDGKIQAWFGKNIDGTYQECFDALHTGLTNQEGSK